MHKKSSEKTQIFLMNNLIINSQFIGSQQTGGSLLVSQYLRIYRSGIGSNRAMRAPQGIRARPLGPRPVALWRLHEPSGLLSKSPGSLLSRKKSPKSFMTFGLRLVLIL